MTNTDNTQLHWVLPIDWNKKDPPGRQLQISNNYIHPDGWKQVPIRLLSARPCLTAETIQNTQISV